MKRFLVLALILTLTIGAVGCSKAKVKTDKQLQKQEKKYDHYANKDVIVSALQAKEIIDKVENIAVIDIRKVPEYLIGHIPGAVNIWRPDYESENYDFGGMRAEKEKVEKLLGSLGIDSDTFILLYDSKGDYDAARLWWILDMYGHKKMALIDGGIDGWKAAGLDTTIDKPDITPKDYKFQGEVDESKLATLEDVKAAIDDPNVIILDTRSLAEATGEELKKGAYRKGRIPTAVWIEYKEALNTGEGADNTFKSAQELKKIYEGKGVTPDKTIIPYCQSAVRSAHTTFVLTQLLGYKNVKNYDGSWIEWSYHKDLQIETGDIK
ncbi:MAG: thiosulfate/3-mercaptopyruvate sulfurtransferase [Clostridiales bacterium]|jgi:thiosulfate/3-mercaptopyruvate sulfurtransferase|nr:thiosulfate/3-mercaptopyruvate sulfurtransferase [Clostridiales bacterium]MDK2933208.1 thiosulfate/3-mercaptopyruvate sulfurtransferase [Clostridiales bacterium]